MNLSVYHLGKSSLPVGALLGDQQATITVGLCLRPTFCDSLRKCWIDPANTHNLLKHAEYLFFFSPHSLSKYYLVLLSRICQLEYMPYFHSVRGNHFRPLMFVDIIWGLHWFVVPFLDFLQNLQCFPGGSRILSPAGVFYFPGLFTVVRQRQNQKEQRKVFLLTQTGMMSPSGAALVG